MEQRILVGTEGGMREFGPNERPAREAFAGRTVTALARDARHTWALIDGREVWIEEGERWQKRAAIEGPPATCLVPEATGLLVGTQTAHLLRLTGDRLEPIESFERVEGRQAWHTPWGDPADVRSLAVDPVDGTIYVNVHVGGVVRSRDGGRTWTPTLDIDVDVHQVIVHPARPKTVLVAAFDGFGLSRDGGDTWRFVIAGLHAHYARAVAITDDAVVLTASTGPNGRRSALYRKPLEGPDEFERCREGLPEWFNDNIDTACLATAGPLVVFGTEDGRLYRSADGGRDWEFVAKGLASVRSVLVADDVERHG
jgi:photosystem II stability/assembly factor-like uncharacterized protein